MDLAEIRRKSDERVAKRLEASRQAEIASFNARTHKSLGAIPYIDDNLIFRQQGRRVSWGREGARYVSARYYPNAECAKQIIDELVRLGAKNVIKEDEEQITLF